MPIRKFDFLDQLKGVEREYRAVRWAMDRLVDVIRKDTTQLAHDLEVSHVTMASNRLEATYLIRIFAAFENALRNFWEVGRKRKTKPHVKVLVENIATLRNVPDHLLKETQDVRKYRNSLVHPHENSLSKIEIKDARRWLCTFLSRLPDEW